MPDRSPALARGDDGRRRCWWGASRPEYVAYHDEEWGRPVRDDRGIYERLVLEGFQSGLSWLTILRKRENFRAAFEGFEIEPAIANAKAAAALDVPLSELVWSFAPRGRRRAPRALEDLPSITPESTALSKELKRRGFRFVGPTTAYAAMQACGLVNDHLAGCWVRAEVEALSSLGDG